MRRFVAVRHVFIILVRVAAVILFPGSLPSPTQVTCSEVRSFHFSASLRSVKLNFMSIIVGVFTEESLFLTSRELMRFAQNYYIEDKAGKLDASEKPHGSVDLHRAFHHVLEHDE